MALNWVTVVDSKPLLLQGESPLEIVDNVKCNLTIPDAPPSASSSAGGSGGLKKLEANGTLTLTDQRLIWTNPGAQSSFMSLTIPLASILSSRFEQPVFGANYLALAIKPTVDGGLTEGTTLDIRFLEAGMFKFVSVLAKTREKAIFLRRRSIEDEENLPEYSSAGTPTGGPVPQYTDLPPEYDS
ncbi:hypothetical protein PAXRUDRAFT_134471 [Paxillus rubicundulus Ve08.2h10]|uniref:Uncharacterized protein n=1 Tax=Paxillus rubicundulus Ve08.2h10 TaxID=930991 RepID=A0A0D0DIU6_9AGAM|nr:hypothetical protein PAXRUDRAFT_134471 [Paxillus rubicundulus Ve08.2h10]